MNNLIPFSYGSSPIRVVQIEGEPWWVAKDVCEVLGIDKHRDALARLDDDERGSLLVDTPGGKQEVGAINESGLYALILRSRKPEAKAFKRWITHEVIPTIRKTGSYSAAPAEDGDPFLKLIDGVKALYVEQQRQATELQAIRAEVEGIKQDRHVTRRDMKSIEATVASLPAPTGELVPVSRRLACVEIQRQIVRLESTCPNEVWNTAYREYSMRKRVRNIKETAEKFYGGRFGSNHSTLGYIEEHGDIDLLHSIMHARLMRSLERAA